MTSKSHVTRTYYPPVTQTDYVHYNQKQPSLFTFKAKKALAALPLQVKLQELFITTICRFPRRRVTIHHFINYSKIVAHPISDHMNVISVTQSTTLHVRSK